PGRRPARHPMVHDRIDGVTDDDDTAPTPPTGTGNRPAAAAPADARPPEAPPPELVRVVDEVERFVHQHGWDTPRQVFALVHTAELLAHEPGLIGQVGDGGDDDDSDDG